MASMDSRLKYRGCDLTRHSAIGTQKYLHNHPRPVFESKPPHRAQLHEGIIKEVGQRGRYDDT